MKIVRPFTVQDADLTTNATNADAAWNSGTAYTVGNRVSYGKRRYESIQNGTNQQPDISPEYWLDLGANNIWAMFDDRTGTQTTRASPLEVEIQTSGYIDTIGLLNLRGNLVHIKATVEGEERTNELLWSEEFDNVAWIKTNATVTADAIVAPDGETTADLVVPSASNGNHLVRQDITVSAAETVTASAYFKAGGYKNIRMLVTSVSSSFQMDVDLSAGSITSPIGASGAGVAIEGGLIEADEGFYRVHVTGYLPGETSYAIAFIILNDSGNQVFSGDGTSGIYMWGAQAEESFNVTDYIPTTSAAASSTTSVILDQERQLLNEAFIQDYYEYFFGSIIPLTDTVFTLPPDAYSPKITITLSGETDVAIGQLILGLSYYIGEVHWGAQLSGTDYSRIEEDDFGNTFIMERAYNRTGKFTVTFPAGMTDAVYNVVTGYRATPILIIGIDKYASSFYYGLLREAVIEIAYPKYSIMTIEARGI